MRIEGRSLPEYYLAGRKRKVTPVETSRAQAQGQDASLRQMSFQKLQQKVRDVENAREETGYLSNIDSQLKLVLAQRQQRSNNNAEEKSSVFSLTDEQYASYVSDKNEIESTTSLDV